MSINAISTSGAPGAIGPYSQGLVAEGWVFVSGQIPLDPATGALAAGSFEDQVRQAVRNVSAILEAAGSGLPQVVKTTVYLTDLSLFPRFNAVYETFFKAPYPARATVQVSALPKGAQIELDAIALLPPS